MRKENLKLIFILIAALILRLIHLNQSFWLDEAAQVIESSRSFLQQFDLVADFHPPLYHLLLHFWIQIDKSEIWVRLLSIGFGIGSIIFIYLIAKSLIGKKEALLSALFLALSPYHIWYSQEARPYMAFVFFSLASCYFLFRKKWILFTVFLIFSLFTNYFTLFLISGQAAYTFLFDKKHLRNFLMGIVVAGLIFIFWLPMFLTQIKLGTQGLFTGWTDVVSVSFVRVPSLTFAKFIFGHGSFENKYLYATIIFPMFFLFVFSLIKSWHSKSGKILMTLFFGPFIVSEAVSLFVPINAPQRLIFLLPMLYLILAFGIYKFPKKLQLVSILIVIFTSLGGVYQYYTDLRVQREQWREAVSFTEKEPNSAKAALFVFPGPFAPYSWYSKNKIEAWGIAPKFVVTDNDLLMLVPRLEKINRVYLYQYLTGLTDPYNKTASFLATYGFKETTVANFAGVGFIYIYDKK